LLGIGLDEDRFLTSALLRATKYELIFGQFGSSGQIQKRPDADQIQGTLLCQALPNQKLKLKTFPGMSGGAVKGFTDSAKIFER
jgi:hypothetical protein